MESSAPVARPTPAALLDPRRWWALALLCGAFFMVILDGTITIVALPSIGADLSFSEQGLQWVLSAYALTFGGVLLLGGRSADLLGRRRVFMAGGLLFTAASLGCGLAWSPEALLFARIVQGARDLSAGQPLGRGPDVHQDRAGALRRQSFGRSQPVQPGSRVGKDLVDATRSVHVRGHQFAPARSVATDSSRPLDIA